MRITTEFLMIFFFGSIAGYLMEIIYKRYLKRKKIMGWKNPGFLYGPYIPPHGLGAYIIFLISITPIENWLKIILITLFPTALEYISGIYLVHFFGVMTWDYSDYKYNYKGIISLGMSIIWMVVGLSYYFLLNPIVLKLLPIVGENLILNLVLILFLLIFTIDFIFSVKRAFGMKKIKGFIDKYANIRLVNW